MTVATVTKREIYIPDGDKLRTKSLKLANAMAVELLNYGIVPEQSLITRISRHTKKAARQFCLDILKMFTIGEVNPALFDEWEHRTGFDFGDTVLRIFGYMVNLCGNDLADPLYMERLKRSVVFDNVQTLKLAKEDAALARFNVLVNSNVALDKESLNGLVALAQTYFASAPKNIRSAEARIAVMLGGVKSGLSVYTALGAVRAQPTDALRYAAAVRDFEGTSTPT
jgi:hypothetical protein